MLLLAALVLTYGCGSCLPGGGAGIVAIHADGTHRQVLVVSARNDVAWQPTWAPDGTRFAYVVERRADRRLWVARADGSARHAITAGTDAFYPAWSPDGMRIAFVRDYELWTVGADGSSPHRIVGKRRHGPIDSPVAWSPNGRRLAFVAGDRLYVVRADGSGLDRLPTTRAADPAWSPDGRSIYYLSGGDNAYIPWVPHRIDVATGRDRLFLARPAPDYVAASWSPDRSWLAYALIIPKGGLTYDDLWLLHLPDRRRIHVTQVPGGIYGLSWEPG